MIHWLIMALALWIVGIVANVEMSTRTGFWAKLAMPIIFGIALIVLWEGAVVGLQVSPIVLPAPSAIWGRFWDEIPTLWADFKQTFIGGALTGYVMGCGAAFLVAILVDKSQFLRAGLLPVGNFVAALPVIGIAPVFVMWFGFGWESKAAVVVAMVFFPMLINTVAGLQSVDAMQRDLMRTYAASYPQTLLKLRLPSAGPFVFNGLKICTTLALIGAIVAEFFGSPVVGMGFRIATGAGRLELDMVWATIAVAAIAGSAFYGVVALIEKRATFWHPSQRR